MGADRLSASAIAELRRTGDPPIDERIAAIATAGGVAALRHLQVQLVDLRIPVGSLPEPVRSFLDRPLEPPAWFDRAGIERAGELFAATPVPTLLALFLRTLPVLFTHGSVTRTFLVAEIFRPGALVRLLPDIAGIVLAAMAPGGLGLAPRGDGTRAFERLRLFHGVVRAVVLDSGRWEESWGSPINQAELALTVSSLVVEDLAGLDRMGVHLAAGDAHATLEVWRTIGLLLGTDEAWLPGSVKDARRIADLLGADDQPTAGSCQLVEQLCNGVGSLLPWGLRSFPAVLVDALLDPAELQALGRRRPYGPLWTVVASLSLLVGRRRALTFVAGPVCRWFFRGWMALARRHEDGPAAPLFALGRRYL